MHFCNMLQKLKERWGVNGFNLVLIIFTFALGGSLCGWTGRKLLLLTNMEKGLAWFLLYIILITILWPVCVLIISFPLGQFAFFKRYILKIWGRIKGKKTKGSDDVIAIFASGAGSNAKKIIDYFKQADKHVRIGMVVCNNPAAGVINIAKENNIPVLIIEKERFGKGDAYLPVLKQAGLNFIVLAGFLWKIPVSIIQAYPKRIVNIHPALLPKYGGKGMYGHHVHDAVIANNEKESGISIHFADELYDHGDVVFRATCELTAADNADTLAKKIHILEQQHYPVVIEGLLKKQNPR
ncbi:hypothetical protein BH11BAC4_BH11BAC4_03820 [soil metagenome]